MNNYGDAIKKLRKKAGMTQNDLGEKLNVSYQAVSKWENNASQPDLDTVQNLVKLFGISMDEFSALASEDDNEIENELTADASAVDDESGNKEQEPATSGHNMLGVCTTCGKSVFENNVGTLSPKIVCSACYEYATNNEIERKKYVATRTKQLKDKEHRKMNASHIVGVIVGFVLLAILLITFSVTSSFNSLTIVISIFAPIFMYTYIAQLFWDGTVYDLADGSTGKTFDMPGIIFSLDIDGIVWAISVKILLFFLSIALMIIVFFGGNLLAILISPFTYFFALARRKDEIGNIVFQTKQPIYDTSSRRRSIVSYVEPEADYAKLNRELNANH